MENATVVEKAGTRSDVLDFLDTLTSRVPAELRTRLTELVPQLLDQKEFEGKVAMIREGRNSTYKAVMAGPHSYILIRFPNSTQLDEDSKSSDPAVAEKAKRLKRFEAILEEAFYDSPEPGRVIVHYDPKPGETGPDVDASRITSISILV